MSPPGDLAERFQWIFEARHTNPGALSEAAGLSRSHIGGILKKIERGEDPNPTPKTMDRIARAANVSRLWLVEGVEPREPYAPGLAVAPRELRRPKASPPPPPTSDVYTISDVDRLISSVFDRTKHDYLDAVPTREALQLSAPLLASLDLRDYTRQLLDTAARWREKGRELDGAELAATTGVKLFEEAREYKQQLEMLQRMQLQSHAWLVENGIDPRNSAGETLLDSHPAQDQALAAEGPKPRNVKHSAKR